ncbi:hypothetical protein HDU76_008728 [Blyttiomyces sp. JEL0837]|nr:hypothetical protein HDU76_008728 [Blyttiomyces sp. JEL0837]
MPHSSVHDALLNDSPHPSIIIPRHAKYHHHKPTSGLPAPNPPPLQPTHPFKVYPSHLRTQVESIRQSRPFTSLHKGDRIALLCQSTLESLTILLAVSSTGASTLPINPAFPIDILKDQIGTANCKAIIISTVLTPDLAANVMNVGSTLGIPVFMAWSSESPTIKASKSTHVVKKHPATSSLIGDKGPVSTHAPPGTVFCTDPVVTVWQLSGHGGPTAADLIPHSQEGMGSSVGVDKNDEVLLLYTSGVTSKPKGVPLSHANILATLANLKECYDLSTSDITYCVMPLFHIHGLIGVLYSTLYSGGTVVMPPRFDPLMFKEDVPGYGVTWFSAVPFMHKQLLRTKDVHGGAKLRFIRSGSASLAPTILLQLERIFKAPVIEAYAITETAHQVTSNFLPPGIRKAGSVGKGRGVEVMIVGRDGKPASTMVSGEVCVRGANLFNAYLKNQHATELAFMPDPSGKGPHWFRTGDLGYLDENEFLYLLGRIPDQIVIKRPATTSSTPFNGRAIAADPHATHTTTNSDLPYLLVSPLEVENALLQLDDVAEAGVFGIPPRIPIGKEEAMHENAFTVSHLSTLKVEPVQEVHAAVVRTVGGVRPGIVSGQFEKLVLDKVRELLPEEVQIVKVHLIERIPRTATGKILRSRLAGLVFGEAKGVKGKL